MKSEVLDNYFKIALEQGLIEKSAYPESKTYTSGFKDGRQGSDDISTIEALYGIKPNGKEDDEHIVDKAHPSTVVVSPAYDKFNGVVENVKQRQQVMSQVALKNPNGNYSQRRYIEATNGLLKSLVKVGYLLDNKDEDKLRALADSCSSELAKEAGFLDFFGGGSSGGISSRLRGLYNDKDEGLSWWQWLGIGLAGTLATSVIINHKDTFDQGTVKNLQLVKQRGIEAIKKAPPMFGNLFQEFADTIDALADLVDELHDSEITSGATQEVVESFNKKIQNFKELSKKYKKQLSKLQPIMEQGEENPKDRKPSNQYMAGAEAAMGFFTSTTAKDFLLAANTASESLDKELNLLRAIESAAGIKAAQIENKEGVKPQEKDPFAESTSSPTPSPSSPYTRFSDL